MMQKIKIKYISLKLNQNFSYLNNLAFLKFEQYIANHERVVCKQNKNTG
jgi:hypothetical protein